MKKPKQRWTGKWTSSNQKEIRSSSSSSSQEEDTEERRRSEDGNSDQDNCNLSSNQGELIEERRSNSDQDNYNHSSNRGNLIEERRRSEDSNSDRDNYNLSSNQGELIEERRRSEDSNSDQDSFNPEELIEERRSNSDEDNYNFSDLNIKKEDESKEVEIECSPSPPHPPVQHPRYLPCVYPRLPYPQPNISNPIFQLPLHQLHPLISPLFMFPTQPTLHKPHAVRPTPTAPFNRAPSPAPDKLQTPDSTLRSPRPRNGKKKLSKDGKIAINLGLTHAEIKKATTYPMDQFQDFCNEKMFREEQINVLKDIRRRYKNKVAAQNCRKRKIDMIEELRDALDNKESENMKQKKRKENLEETKKHLEAKMKKTKDRILRKMGKNPSMFAVEVNKATSQVTIIKRENYNG